MVDTLAALAGRLPPPVARAIGRRLGDLIWVAVPSRRVVALANVAQAFPGMSESERRRLAYRSFQHLGMVAVEVCRAVREPVSSRLADVHFDGLAYVEHVMATHGRALVVTAHLGNWELLTVLGHRLSGVPMSIVVRPLDTSALNGVVGRLRAMAGATIIDKREAVRPILRALRRGGLVAILLDQNASRREGVFVPFFGRLASTSRSAATLAVRTGTPILPLFIRREPDGRHRVTIEPAITPPAGAASEEGIVELTRRCTCVIEDAIRHAPEQWLWMHARWRTRPPEEARE